MPHASANGVRLRYEQGTSGGPTALLVHGAAGSSENWFQQLPALEEAGFRWLTYDLRGAGRSEAPEGAEGDGSVVGDLEGLVGRLQLEPFFLIAQAAGGFGAFEYALSNPAMVRGLIVANSFGGVTDPEYLDYRRSLEPEGLDSWPREARELGRSFRESNPQGVKLFLEMERRGRSDFARRQKPRTPVTFSQLENLRVPVLIIASDEDVLSPPPLMRMIADRLPDCRFEVIKGTGHCSYFEKPAEWNRLAVGFLSSHL